MTLLTGITALWVLVPAASISTVEVASGSKETTFLIHRGINLLLGTVLVVALARGGWGAVDRFMFRAALREEAWFRLGSETWSWRRRVQSCVGFGFAHVLNIVLMTASLGLLTLCGAAFMAVYQRQLKKTGDRRKALYIAARFHADYNMTVVGLLLLFTYSLTLLGTILSFVV